MVKRNPVPAPPRTRPNRFPLHHVMTEAESFAALRDEVQAFRDENHLLRERLAALEEESRTHNPTPLPVPTPEPPEPPESFTPTSFREPKIDPPPEFDGKVSEYATFLDHCEFYFDNKPSMFLNNDKNKVSLVISRLRGRAATWAHALRRTNPANPAFLSWPLFRALMNSLFEDTYYLEQVRHDFRALKQKGSARNFSIEFKTFASILQLDEATMISEYKEKLKDTVQQGIAYTTGITSFELLVAKSIEIDQVLYKIAKASSKKDESRSQRPTSKDSTPSQSKNTSSSSSHPKHSTLQNASASHASTSRSSNPSHPRGPISPEERERRAAHKLCMYCADPDHAIRDCPRLQIAVKKGYAKPRQTVSSVSTTSSLTTVVVPPSGNPPPQGSTRQDH